MDILHRRTLQPPAIARRRGLLAALAVLLSLLALSACGPATPQAAPTPTKTLRPTFTPTSAAIAMATQTADAAATEAARATATPTQTSTPTVTPTATDTPAPPTDTPAPPTATPAPATATPRPAVVAPPTAAPTQPPPPSGDAAECAALGGDGCKFRLRGGPAFASSPGELKLTLGFIHSGRNNEAQGSYFIALQKDGVGRLPISDSVRSWPGERRTGPNGLYNYEYKLGLEPLGGSVAGCYVGWVLDGNGERDSLNFSFCVPEGQGEVWMEFDQA